MTVRCPQRLSQGGFHGDETRSMLIPDPLVAVCPGDFLTSTTVGSELEAALISTVAWNTSLLQTQKDAKVVFRGVSLAFVDTDTCFEQEARIPYAHYRQGSHFLQEYEIVDATGAAAPTTWVQGQGFTFAKNPSSNALVNNKIQKTSDPLAIVFRAVRDSGAVNQATALVEFAD